MLQAPLVDKEKQIGPEEQKTAKSCTRVYCERFTGNLRDSWKLIFYFAILADPLSFLFSIVPLVNRKIADGEVIQFLNDSQNFAFTAFVFLIPIKIICFLIACFQKDYISESGFGRMALFFGTVQTLVLLFMASLWTLLVCYWFIIIIVPCVETTWMSTTRTLSEIRKGLGLV